MKRPPVGKSGSAYGTWIIYDEAERLRGLIAQHWEVDPNTGEPTDPGAFTRALHKEFRYDGNRQRYLEREWQPQPIPLKLYYNAWGVQEAAIGSDETRYGYVGAEGYQTEANTAYQHLGARYYDPAIGRFLMRDPIGIDGGLNVYAYVKNSPSRASDPEGLMAMDTRTEMIMREKPPKVPELTPLEKEMAAAEHYEEVDKELETTIKVLKFIRKQSLLLGFTLAFPASAPVKFGVSIGVKVLANAAEAE